MLAHALRFFLGQSHLAIIFIRGYQPLLEHKPQRDRTRSAHEQNHEDKTSIHNSPNRNPC